MNLRWLAVGTGAALLAVGALLVATMAGARVAGSRTLPVAGLLNDAEMLEPGWSVAPGASEFVVAQQVENRGRLPLVIFGVFGATDDPLFLVDATWLSADTRTLGPDTRGMALPLHLAAGEEAQLLVRYRLRECPPQARGTGSLFESVVVNHRVLGLGGETGLRFSAPVRASHEAFASTRLCS